jgi:hypothetical protein
MAGHFGLAYISSQVLGGKNGRDTRQSILATSYCFVALIGFLWLLLGASEALSGWQRLFTLITACSLVAACALPFSELLSGIPTLMAAVTWLLTLIAGLLIGTKKLWMTVHRAIAKPSVGDNV